MQAHRNPFGHSMGRPGGYGGQRHGNGAGNTHAFAHHSVFAPPPPKMCYLFTSSSASDFVPFWSENPSAALMPPSARPALSRSIIERTGWWADLITCRYSRASLTSLSKARSIYWLYPTEQRRSWLIYYRDLLFYSDVVILLCISSFLTILTVCITLQAHCLKEWRSAKKKLELERLPADKRLSLCFHNLGKALVDVGNNLEYLLTCFFIIMQRPA